MSGEMNEPSAREQRVNEAIAAYLGAVDAGRTPDPKEFIAAHGDIAVELEAFFANRDEFERVAKPLQPARATDPKAHPDNVKLPPASDDRTVRLWEPATGRATGTLTGHAGPVLAAAIAPDGRTVVSGGEDKVVRLWHAATGHELAALPGHAAMVVALAFSPDGTVLASGADDGSVRLWWADVSLQTPGSP